MHELAAARLTHFSPSQLCTLLAAKSGVGDRSRSPLFPKLEELLHHGMSLSLFAEQDLASLAWLCGQVSHTTASSVAPLVPCIRAASSLCHASNAGWGTRIANM
jgi:hypothetical protein